MKSKESHSLSDAEIKEELGRLRTHLFDLGAQRVTQKLEDPTQVAKTRRDVARLLTEQRARDMKNVAVASSKKRGGK